MRGLQSTEMIFDIAVNPGDTIILVVGDGGTGGTGGEGGEGGVSSDARRMNSGGSGGSGIKGSSGYVIITPIYP